MHSMHQRPKDGVCRVAELIGEHVPLLMQLLTNEPAMRDFNLQLVTTKCLNTAVMLMVLLLGERSLEQARQCSVGRVRERFQVSASGDRARADMHSADGLAGAVLAPLRGGRRRLHYVMLTDGDMPVDGGRGHVYFPGHVFVIEKEAEGSYGLYQSFIKQYDLAQHVRHRGGSLRLDEPQMRLVMGALVRFVPTATWDAQCSEALALLTHLDAEQFRPFHGAAKHSAVLLCHRELELEGSCADVLARYAAHKAAELAPPGPADAKSVYGDASLYAAAGAQPLTVAQVRAGLAGLLARLPPAA
jgi:hypothetical protein